MDSSLYILDLSDIHGGSAFAPCHPDADDTSNEEHPRKVALNGAQRYLNECWDHMVTNLPSKLDATIVDGDSIDGENPKEHGLYLTLNKKSDQAACTYKLLSPIRERSKFFYVIKGTPYHEGRASEAIEGMAIALDATRFPGGRRCGFRLWLEMGGKVINAAHHMTRGWIYPSGGADRTALMSAAAYSLDKLPKADIIIRAHNHIRRVVEAYDRWVIFNPAWKLLTPWAEKAMEETRAELYSDIGAVLIEITPQGNVWIDTQTFKYKNKKPKIARPQMGLEEG